MKQEHVKMKKRTYHAPLIQTFGTIGEITKATGNQGTKDGGSGNTSRTQ